MASIIEPIQDIMAELTAIEAVQYVRIWNNQVQKIDAHKVKMEMFPLPACFVETIAPEQLASIGCGSYAGDVTFRIHVVMEELDAGGGNMGQNVNIFALKDAVVAKLFGFKPTGCSILQRKAESQNYDHDNIYHYQIDYITHFIDNVGVPAQTIKQPPTALQIDK